MPNVVPGDEAVSTLHETDTKELGPLAEKWAAQAEKNTP